MRSMLVWYIGLHGVHDAIHCLSRLQLGMNDTRVIALALQDSPGKVSEVPRSSRRNWK